MVRAGEEAKFKIAILFSSLVALGSGLIEQVLLAKIYFRVHTYLCCPFIISLFYHLLFPMPTYHVHMHVCVYTHTLLCSVQLRVGQSYLELLLKELEICLRNVHTKPLDSEYLQPLLNV